MTHDRVRPGAAPWTQIVKVCGWLRYCSTSPSPGSWGGDLQTYSFVRKSITKVLNSGTAWAGVAFYAGWKVIRLTLAFLSGSGGIAHPLRGWLRPAHLPTR